MAYLISARQRKLLTLLSRENVITGEVLASLLSVTSRTVRNEVSSINTILGCIIIRSSSKGYSLDPQYFHLLRETQVYADEKSLRMLLIWNIFSNRCSNKAVDLADEYFVNVSTIHQILNCIREDLALYQLQLVKKGPFYRVEGTEFARRIFLNTMILQDAHSGAFDIETFDSLFEQIDITQLRSALLTILLSNSLHPEQVNLDSLTLNIAIAFDRLLKNQPVNFLFLQLPFLPESAEYRSAEDIAHYFSRQYHMEVSEQDIRYFYLLVFGQTKRPYENLLDEAFISAVDVILSKTFQRFNLVCPYKPILEELAYHIYFLIIRCRIGTATCNSLVDNLKNQSPFIYDVAVNLAEQIHQHFSVVVEDSEIGYLALILGSMLDQENTPDEKLNVVIVCGTHRTVGQKIQERLTEHFSGQLNFLGTIASLPCHVASSEHLLFLSCLFEAVPYENVLTVGAILSERDIRHIEDYLSSYRQKIARERFHSLAKDFFSEKLFFHNRSFSDKYEIIRFLTQKLKAYGYASEAFGEEVLKRERISSTCFMDSFALPHALTFSAERSALCILSSDTALSWDQHQIKFVCLLALAQKDRERFQPLYQHLVDILCDPQSLSDVTEAADFASFMEQMSRL